MLKKPLDFQLLFRSSKITVALGYRGRRLQLALRVVTSKSIKYSSNSTTRTYHSACSCTQVWAFK